MILTSSGCSCEAISKRCLVPGPKSGLASVTQSPSASQTSLPCMDLGISARVECRHLADTRHNLATHRLAWALKVPTLVRAPYQGGAASNGRVANKTPYWYSH